MQQSAVQTIIIYSPLPFQHHLPLHHMQQSAVQTIIKYSLLPLQHHLPLHHMQQSAVQTIIIYCPCTVKLQEFVHSTQGNLYVLNPFSALNQNQLFVSQCKSPYCNPTSCSLARQEYNIQSHCITIYQPPGQSVNGYSLDTWYKTHVSQTGDVFYTTQIPYPTGKIKNHFQDFS